MQLGFFFKPTLFNDQLIVSRHCLDKLSSHSVCVPLACVHVGGVLLQLCSSESGETRG